MKDSAPFNKKDKNEENKFKSTIHNMIYKLIEEDENSNSIDFQEKQIPQNLQTILIFLIISTITTIFFYSKIFLIQKNETLSRIIQ